MRDGGSPRRSGSESGSIATPDDDKYNKPKRPDAEEPLWLGMPVNVLKERMGVLAGLMVIQSASGMILSRFEDMLKEHVVVTLFLTMLVGAGGNAGNQSTVNIIRGLATGQVNTSNARSVILVEAKLGLVLGIVLATIAWSRVMLSSCMSSCDTVSAMAIGAPAPLRRSASWAAPRLPPACLEPPLASCSCTPPTPRRLGLLHRRHLDHRRRLSTHLPAPEWHRRCARRTGHPGADGHRRSDDHMPDLRPALHLFWSTATGRYFEVAQRTSRRPAGRCTCSTFRALGGVVLAACWCSFRLR